MPEPHPVTHSRYGCQDDPLKADPCHEETSGTPPHKCCCDVHSKGRIPESILMLILHRSIAQGCWQARRMQ